ILNATGEDIKLIYAKPNSWTLQIGSLHQDAGTPAYLMSQEFLSKHSAIVGTTGSGKSCALTLILRTLLTAHPNGHVVMLDPHGEYATAFDDIAELITPDTMQLPYWLLSFEEIVEVLCSSDPIARSREAPILKEVIMAAKQDFLGAGALSPDQRAAAHLGRHGQARPARQLAALSAPHDHDREFAQGPALRLHVRGLDRARQHGRDPVALPAHPGQRQADHHPRHLRRAVGDRQRRRLGAGAPDFRLRAAQRAHRGDPGAAGL